MIWFTLALFAVSFLAVALLAPKPNIENARKEQLDPESFPRATEDAPIPLVLGTAVVRGPNTLWYGGFRSRKIREKVKTGLFSSKKVTVGYKYNVGLHMGICLGPAVLTRINWDGKNVFSGRAGSQDDFNYAGTALNDFVVYTNDVVSPGTFDTLSTLGITNDLVDSGNLLFNMSLTVTYTPGDPSPLWGAQIFVRFRDGSNNVLPSGGSYNANTGLSIGTGSRSISLTDIPVPVGARIIELFGNIPITAFGGSLTITNRTVTIVGFNTSEETIDIDEPELYGGHKRGGGISGNVNFYPGTFTQTVNSYLEGQLGSGNVPAYRGTCHIVLPDFYIGESPSLRAVEYEVECTTVGLTIGTPLIGPDMNCAEAIYECLTNKWRGLGVDPSKIDLASFQAAATTLSSEGNGCSVIVSSPSDAKRVIVEILRQADGVLRENAQGQIEMVLIRADYDPTTLLVYDEDDIVEVSSFTKTAWEDVISEVKVSFSTREKEGTRIALAQNQAIINMLGRRKTSEVSFPFCYDPTLANILAARELSVLSIPLFRMKVVMNRNGYDLRVGDVIKVSWLDYDLSQVIMRVQRVDLGQIDDNKITLELVQDVFSVNTPVFLEPEDSSWVDPTVLPEDVTSTAVEMPYFYSAALESPVPDGYGSIIVFPIKPQVESTGFSTFKGPTTTDITNNDISDQDYVFTGLITAQILNTDGFATGILTSFTVDNFTGETPIDVTTAQVREGELGIIYINGEWMAYEDFTDNLDNTYTFGMVYRGLFGTRPLTHADNTRMFIFSTSLLESGSFGNEILDNATAYYKVSDITPFGTRDPSAITESSFVLQQLADSPLRPRNLQLDSTRTLPFEVSTTHSLSWVSSNRAEPEVVFEQDAADTPDETEEYDVEVWIDGVEDLALADTNITSPYVIDFTGKSGVSGEIRLYSRRTTGGKTSRYYAFFPITFPVGTIDSTAITIDSMTTTVDSA